MGYIRHDAIVVTSWHEGHLQDAKDQATLLGLGVTEIARSKVNGYLSFLICPDGSKEGWDASDDGDEARDKWKAWVTESGLYVDWAHVNYGGDEPNEASLIAANRERP